MIAHISNFHFAITTIIPSMKITAELVKSIKKAPESVLTQMSADDIAGLIQEANFRYYNKGTPMFTDTMFDLIKDYLRVRDPTHPILEHVGAVVKSGKKVKLPYWMGSLDKIKSSEKDVTKWLGAHPGHVVISDKLDGNSAMYVWDAETGRGSLMTRGNGSEGQDVSHLLPFLADFPKPSASVAVRGELIISKRSFEGVANRGKNARNMVAGLLNAKKPDLALLNVVEFVAYEMLCCSVRGRTLSQQIARMKSEGFKVVEHVVLPSHDVDVEHLSKILHARRKGSPYDVDGIVVCHDASHELAKDGNPKYAFAFKSVTLMDHAEVVVTSVEWNLSKDGYYKPVVIFDAVELAGVSVRRATGHNAKFIVDNKIGPGARIVVMRSGDVIPYIKDVLEGAETLVVPEGRGVRWNDTGVDLVWSNATRENPELNFKALVFFFDKVDVPGLSSGTLRKLFNAGVDSVGKVISVDIPTLMRIEGFKDKSAQKLVAALHARMHTVDQITLMAASNCFGRGVGVRILTAITRECPKILNGHVPSLDELVSINGIEKKTAVKVIDGMRAWDVFKRENLSGIQSRAKSPPKVLAKAHDVFVGKSVVFTGVRDKDIEARLVAMGAEVKTSVSRKTTWLVYAPNPNKPPSSKVKDAEKHGVPTITLDDFKKLLT